MIRVQDLGHHYGSVEAVADVSFEIERGQVVGFLGPNGAGKSTTMRILCGYLWPERGLVEVAGARLPEQSFAARRHVGYLPEHTPLYTGMRVGGYLEYAARLRGLSRGALKAALGRCREQCGLDGVMGRRIGELSKGYRQRVGLAQALIGDPDVLILDEPSSGLDPNEVARMRALVRELGREKTVLLSTHVLSEVEEICPRVVILAGGRVVADGEVDALAAELEPELLVRFAAERGGVPAERAGIPAERAGVAEELGRIEGAAGVAEIAPATFRVTPVSGVASIDALAASISACAAARGWSLVELSVQRASLEDLFALRTATPARDSGAAS